MSLTELKKVQWGMLTGEQLKELSVVNVVRPNPKERENASIKDSSLKKAITFEGTPSDPKMGDQRSGYPCETCNKTNKDCPGHFGTIELPFPVYNEKVVNIVFLTVQSVCSECSRTRIIPAHLSAQGLDSAKGLGKLKKIAKKSKAVGVCPWEDCRKPLLYFFMGAKNDFAKIYYSPENCKNPKKEEFTAEEAYDVLNRISNETSKILGFNENLEDDEIYRSPDYLLDETYFHAHQLKPTALIYTQFPVISPLGRPYVQDGDEKKEDDLTAKYDALLEAIISYNNISSVSGSSVSTRRGCVKTKASISKEIMEHIWTLVDNKDKKSKIKSGNKSHRSLTCRIIQKEGRIQQNVMGKRTDYSARSVVTGGGIYLRNDEIGVPQDIADVETYPEFAIHANIEWLQELTASGKVNTVERKDIDKLSQILKYTTVKIHLHTREDKGASFKIKLGDKVHRKIRDGDPCLINRQPTLIPSGMICFKTKIIPGYAFRLPLAYTNGMNADFDGAGLNSDIAINRRR